MSAHAGGDDGGAGGDDGGGGGDDDDKMSMTYGDGDEILPITFNQIYRLFALGMHAVDALSRGRSKNVCPRSGWTNEIRAQAGPGWPWERSGRAKSFVTP